MTGRELGTSLLIGAVSGVVVTVMAWALSGSPMIDLLEAAPFERASRSPSGSGSSTPSTATPSAPTPTAVQTAQPSTAPTDGPIGSVTFEEPGVKAGLPAQSGSYGATTPVVPRGGYISWRGVVAGAGPGVVVDVEVATRHNGTWTGWSKLTTRTIGADGAVVFSWRQGTPAWISVRFALPSGHSSALQGRWQ
jgi:hypothetical protein